MIDSMDRRMAEFTARRGVAGRRLPAEWFEEPGSANRAASRRPGWSVVLSVAVALLVCMLAGTLSSSALPATAADRSGPGQLAGDPAAALVATDPALADGATIPAPQQVALATALPDERARIAIATATAQLGLPYVWGGNGPSNGDAGFDCSGLTTFSYRAAGVALPRTAHTQYYAGPRVPDGTPLQPGDLVFYGTSQFVHHVGMYLGDGRMINAPRFGKPVQTAFHRWNGDDYLGASRPAMIGQPGVPPAQPAPAPVRPPNAPDAFEAPVAPPVAAAVAAAPVEVAALQAAATTVPSAATSVPGTSAAATNTSVAPTSAALVPNTPSTSAPVSSSTAPSVPATSTTTDTSTSTSSATASSSSSASSSAATTTSAAQDEPASVAAAVADDEG